MQTEFNTWFTSDHHLGHENIIKYTERPYDSVQEMDEDLIKKWNSVVDIGDVVYHLGDFTLGGINTSKKYFSRLNGHVHILNNFWHHDKRWISNGYGNCYTKSDVVLIEDPILVLELEQIIVLSHYPQAIWDRKHYGAWHLHGHSHTNSVAEGKILDVGVDSAFALLGEYRPFSLSEVIEIMDKK